jgi:translation initiation factor IF-2
LGKTKVHELAKELGMSNTELIKRLENDGIEVKTHLSILEDSVVDKIKGSVSANSQKAKEGKKDMDKQQMHIIRRNVKVISTDGEKSEVEEISTNISGEIKKSHHSLVENNNSNKNNYSKDGLGVVTPRQPYASNQKYGNNRNMNVVVTRNGKPVENNMKTEVEEVKSLEHIDTQEKIVETRREEKLNIPDTQNISEKVSISEEKVNNPNNSFNQNQINPQRNFQNNNNYRNNNSEQKVHNSGYNRPYNNDRQENRPNNGGYNRPYNNDRQENRPNNGGYNRPYNNDRQENRPNNGGYNRPYNNDRQDNRPNNGGYNRPYNNDRQDNRPNNGGYNRPYNNDRQENRPNNGGYNRPYNNDRQDNRPNNSGYNRPYNNNNNGFRKPPVDNTNYQVNKFIKQEPIIPIEQKETREYSNTIIDKKKYNNKLSNDSKNDVNKTKLDKNKLREQHSRVSTSKLKGLEVDSSSGMLDLYVRETDMSRKSNGRRKQVREKPVLNQTKIIPMTEVKLPEIMTVKEFAESIKKQTSEIIKKLFALGILATVNQEIDFDTAFLIAEEFGITAEKQVVVTEEDILFDDSEDEDKDLVARPPIVVVMGHVDHGKTSLLDKIRSAEVVQGEAGGITQHIGAYKVKCNDREICFLDTPGHEAFTAMRARGAQVTDIAIIVVAADDGIKPQTIEAIDHAKAAGVSIVVAINKIDKPTANIDKVKQELMQVGLVAEEWGGDTICVPISAMTGEGIDNLLEMILLVADMKDLKANPNKQAKGTILEARLDKNTGTVASMLVQRGQLNVGDTIVVGDIIGKVRTMKDDKGKKVKVAGPSTPVEITGLSEVPNTGDVFYEVQDEKTAKQLVGKRKAAGRRELIKQGSKVTLDDLFGQIKEGKLKDLNVIIKADVQGSVEALKESLEKLSNDEVRVRILHASTGGVKESDVTLASVSNAIIIGFNVRPEAQAAIQADKEKVDLRFYRVIYDAIQDVEVALKGMLPKKYKEVMYGTCEVRKIFKITGVGIVAGCYVKSGKIVRGSMVRLVRDSIVIFEIKIDSLKREKDDVKEVAEGYECGIKLEKFSDIKEGDIFESFDMQEEKRV